MSVIIKAKNGIRKNVNGISQKRMAMSMNETNKTAIPVIRYFVIIFLLEMVLKNINPRTISRKIMENK